MIVGRKTTEQKNEKAIALDNGRWLQPQNGKYESGITLLTETNNFPKWERVTNLNCEIDGHPFALHGAFRMSKQGKPCFDMTGAKLHKLINISWGGSFDKSTGKLPEDIKADSIYTVRKSSNGGGMGHTFVVLPIDWASKPKKNDWD